MDKLYTLCPIYGTDSKVCLEFPVRVTNAPRNPYPSGYGAKIPTSYTVYTGKRWQRVYCACYSNVGRLWITDSRYGKLTILDYIPMGYNAEKVKQPFN